MNLTYKDLLDKETELIYTITNGKRRKTSFKIASCLNIENYESEEIKLLLLSLEQKFGKKKYLAIKRALIRFSFLIQTTDNTPGIESDTTLYRTRWDKVLENDSRFSSYEDCLQIFKYLCGEFLNFSEENIEDIFAFYRHSGNYFQIDYISKDLDNIHCVNNISLSDKELFKNYTKLKVIIFNPEYNSNINQFRNFLKKITTKAYKTDRSKTGNYKTNREFRWETLPTSPQFALFKDCVEIEYKLLLQICQFKNVESKLKMKLIETGLIENQIYKCPITGRELDYEELKSVASENIIHGQSTFQVGHLQPLKNGGSHIAENIGWQTEDGNRIQGNLSLEKVDEMLREIYTLRPELHSNIVDQ